MMIIISIGKRGEERRVVKFYLQLIWLSRKIIVIK
jgi:hypothetical protein